MLPPLMALISGTRVGSYEIVGALGAGGMGEVYRARDKKLGREVALKILPENLAADPERLSRFRREAQVLAALNHPNIGHIYGFEDSGVTSALVLELVEGPTLADRIAGGPVPLDEALPIARQIVDALEAAHEQGIIHRDLKPANIKVRDDGTVKVLDFGLAKALESPAKLSPLPSDPHLTPTMTSPVTTHVGVLLGTAAYISPEQVKGKAADKRSDIWAFGVVLAEMLTGRMLFAGETTSETLAAVIKDDPGLDRLPSSTPRTVRFLLERCLARDPKQRLRDIGEARILLAQPFDGSTKDDAPRPSRRMIAGLAAGGLLVAALLGIAAWELKPAAEVPYRRFELSGPISASNEFALSRDGTRIVYVIGGHLYIRPLDALEPIDLGPVHITAAHLSWSPDSRAIAFTAEGKIQTIPAAGGPVFVVCTIPASGRVLAVRWLESGRILFSVWRDNLYEVAATGGTPAVRLRVDRSTEIDFHYISSLPDGRLIVAAHQRDPDQEVQELVDGNTRIVLNTDRTANMFEYDKSGLLLFRRIATNTGVWTVPFTAGAVDMTRAVLVERGGTDFSAADDGTLLVAMPAPSKSSLVWVDRSGAATPIAGSPVEIRRLGFAISPDGHRVVFVIGAGLVANVVVRDLDTGVDTPLTLNKADDPGTAPPEAYSPAWFPSGDRIIYGSGRTEAGRVVVKNSDAAAGERELTAGTAAIVSHDGRTVVFRLDDRGRGRLRWATLQPDGSAGPGSHVFPTDDEPDVREMILSPDDRSLAYEARQPDGRSDLFIESFPGGAAQRLIAEGARRPRFSRDGREIFYLKGEADERGRPKGMLMSVPVTATEPMMKLGAAVPLFDDSTPGRPNLDGYDVAPDGRRFLMTASIASPAGTPARVVLVQNWRAAMKK
jgi:Tol biopolymer transport system component